MTATIGYVLSSEEHPAPDLVRNAVRAEEAGFGALLISNHLPAFEPVPVTPQAAPIERNNGNGR